MTHTPDARTQTHDLLSSDNGVYLCSCGWRGDSGPLWVMHAAMKEKMEAEANGR